MSGVLCEGNKVSKNTLSLGANFAEHKGKRKLKVIRFGILNFKALKNPFIDRINAVKKRIMKEKMPG